VIEERGKRERGERERYGEKTERQKHGDRDRATEIQRETETGSQREKREKERKRQTDKDDRVRQSTSVLPRIQTHLEEHPMDPRWQICISPCCFPSKNTNCMMSVEPARNCC
jgi:hypothetical protein